MVIEWCLKGKHLIDGSVIEDIGNYGMSIICFIKKLCFYKKQSFSESLPIFYKYEKIKDYVIITRFLKL